MFTAYPIWKLFEAYLNFVRKTQTSCLSFYPNLRVMILGKFESQCFRLIFFENIYK